MPRTKPIAMHTPATIVRFRVTAAAPPPVSRAAPSASKSAPRAPTIKPTSPMRLAVPAAKAAISPITREGSTAADQPRGYRRDKLMPRCAGRSPLAYCVRTSRGHSGLKA